jgi:predicted choloylglycine hydrolase
MEDGLTVSLTFEGRNDVGVGFGFSFIMRYILEFCSTLV